uniref:FMRFamide-like neuropeptides 3 n=1 Tax=Ascaris suum TaxID=6253 RepID=F1LGS0_ASCSU
MHASIFAFALLTLRMALASESNEDEYVRRQWLNGAIDKIGNRMYMTDEDGIWDGIWASHVNRANDDNSNTQRSIRTPLGTMRFGKRDANPLGTMRFGKRTSPNDEQLFDEKRNGPLGTMRFGKRGDPLGTMRFGKRGGPLGTMRFGKR